MKDTFMARLVSLAQYLVHDERYGTIEAIEAKGKLFPAGWSVSPNISCVMKDTEL